VFPGEIPVPDPVTAPARAEPPAAPTVEVLIAELEKLRTQKAALEAREKAVVTKLQERLKDQKDRLNKLGVLPQNPPLPPDIRDELDDKRSPPKK
jgi:hypothetical protein